MSEQLTIIPEEDAREFSETLAMSGGALWRQIALAFKMQIPEALGMDRRQWAEAYPGYWKMAIEERREAVAELTEEGFSQRQVADTLGVGVATVNRDLDVPNGTPAPESQPAPERAPVPNGTPDPEPTLVPDAVDESDSEPLTTRELLSQSDQNDWRTPRKFLEAARAVMGGIDIDPASSSEANQTVCATLFYTEEDDGLAKPWKGRLWLNPPYGGQARLFVERALKEYQVGNITAACLLVNSHPTETKWFQELFSYHVCFVRGRIDFGGPSREVSSSSTHGSAIVYMGDDPAAFASAFKRFGRVVSER